MNLVQTYTRLALRPKAPVMAFRAMTTSAPRYTRIKANPVRTADLPGPYDLHIPTVELAYEKHPRASAKAGATDAPIKEPIIFVHGIFGSKSNTRTVSRVLARDLDRDVYCVDMRNHGDSPHTPLQTYPALAADIEHFIDCHKLGPSILVGHSMGAKAVMAVALRPRASELVAGLVSVDNAPWNAQLSSDFPKYVRALQQIEAAHLTRTQEAYAMLSKQEPNVTIQQFLLSNMKRASQLPVSAKHELVERLHSRLRAKAEAVPAGHHPHDHHPHRDARGIIHDHSTVPGTGSPTAAAKTATAALDAEISEAEKHVLHFRVPLDIIGKSLDHMADFPYFPFETRYSGPTLFVRGMKSHYVPDEAIPLIGELFPKFTLKDVDSGHWVISEKPMEFLEYLKDFISREIDLD